MDFQACALCGDCIVPCIAGARMISGKVYTPRELCREAAKDAAFYRRGGGGVTVSGGEVLAQWEAVAETLRLCRGQNLNTCMETSAFGPWEHLWAMAQYCHTVFVDLKHMDSAKHKALTGVPNERILENIRRLCEELPKRRGKVIVRMPLVPGYNDEEEELLAAAKFVASLPNRPELNLLPYHNLGESKYEMIGLDYALGSVESRKGKDPRLLEIQALCQKAGPRKPGQFRGRRHSIVAIRETPLLGMGVFLKKDLWSAAFFVGSVTGFFCKKWLTSRGLCSNINERLNGRSLR